MLYRVWTKDVGGRYSTLSAWGTRSECKKSIIGRWGHWPPFAYISTAISTMSFRRYNEVK
jgi:hypothetical protein